MNGFELIIEDALTKGSLWPDPLIQMNPAFEAGEWIGELVDPSVLREVFVGGKA